MARLKVFGLISGFMGRSEFWVLDWLSSKHPNDMVSAACPWFDVRHARSGKACPRGGGDVHPVVDLETLVSRVQTFLMTCLTLWRENDGTPDERPQDFSPRDQLF